MHSEQLLRFRKEIRLRILLFLQPILFTMSMYWYDIKKTYTSRKFFFVSISLANLWHHVNKFLYSTWILQTIATTRIPNTKVRPIRKPNFEAQKSSVRHISICHHQGLHYQPKYTTTDAGTQPETLDILLRQIITFIKVRVTFVFGLHRF